MALKFNIYNKLDKIAYQCSKYKITSRKNNTNFDNIFNTSVIINVTFSLYKSYKSYKYNSIWRF